MGLGDGRLQGWLEVAHRNGVDLSEFYRLRAVREQERRARVMVESARTQRSASALGGEHAGEGPDGDAEGADEGVGGLVVGGDEEDAAGEADAGD